ncbi:hypothetical protein [Hymenobacter sp. YC55]|uniref:hypothetical protein n=1 Tax=Hymenobacter sp. YC55 TaxID=3034019 RepID=UPI0023F73BEF|nr:hypothetical protein [Hymenobacter sp. YC55]MDF7810721.1 hypothetical protein [Hymenobacter sp. YC55]
MTPQEEEALRTRVSNLPVTSQERADFIVLLTEIDRVRTAIQLTPPSLAVTLTPGNTQQVWVTNPTTGGGQWITVVQTPPACVNAMFTVPGTDTGHIDIPA